MSQHPYPEHGETLVQYLLRTRTIPDLLEIVTQGPRPSERAAWGCGPDTYHHCANMALASAYAALTEEISV